MKHDEFIGQVQARARLSSHGDAGRTTRATLETLGERLADSEPKDLGAQLPCEIGHHLHIARNGAGGTAVASEFFDRVSKREGVDMPIAIHHARAVVSVLQEAVSAGELRQVRDQLSDEYAPLFDSGSDVEMRA